MTKPGAKDFLGRELAIGDAVVFIAPGYRLLVLGKVTAFTPKNVRIEYINTWNFGRPGRKAEMLQAGSQLTKVDGVDLTMYLLGKE